jgi:hypothetical protein
MRSAGGIEAMRLDSKGDRLHDCIPPIHAVMDVLLDSTGCGRARHE